MDEETEPSDSILEHLVSGQATTLGDVTVKDKASQFVLVVKNPPINARDVRHMDSIPGSGRRPGEGHGSPL